MSRFLKIGLFVCLILLFTPSISMAKTSDSIKGEKIYQVLIDRYNNGNQKHSEAVDVNDPYAYHGGDFKGIQMKLDTIKEAGFTTISLSSIAENRAGGYHGYWIENFEKINEEFGTIEELQELVQTAHDKDMKVVLEFVTGYASETNVLFENNNREDWILTEDIKLDEPWNDGIVALDLENEEVQNYFNDLGHFWLDETKADGFLLHAADQLPVEFVKTFSESMKEVSSDVWILAHTLQDNPHVEELKKIATVDAVQNRKLQQALLDSFENVTNDLDSLFEEDAGLIFLDDAYTKRFAQHVGETGRNATNLWRLALTYLYTANGVPMIYQGSEMPMFAPGYPESQELVQFNSGDPDLQEFFERIGALRREFSALSTGSSEFVGSTEAMAVFKRENESDTFLIAINNDDRSQAVIVDDLPKGKQLTGYLNDNLVRENDEGQYVLTLPRESSEIYRLEEDKGINWIFIGFMISVMLIFIISVIYLIRKDKKRNHELQ